MRGVQKKVIYLRHPESALFDEVLFVLKADAEGTRTDGSSIAAEATKILEDAAPAGYPARRKGSSFRAPALLFAFALGFCLSTLISLAALWIRAAF